MSIEWNEDINNTKEEEDNTPPSSTVEFCLSQPLQRIVLTDKYKRAIEIYQSALKEHILKNGFHRMRSEFDRDSGTGHLYCLSCHELVWEDSEEEEEVLR